jgi:hypothetical protein
VHVEHLCSLPYEAPTPDPLSSPPVGGTSLGPLFKDPLVPAEIVKIPRPFL